jgi:hypothetical protein
LRASFTTASSEPGAANEDFVVASDQVVVVLDGVSVPDGLDTGCVHGTPWYARQLGSRLFAGAVCEPEAGLAEVLGQAIEEVTGLHADTCDLDHPGTPAATVAVLRAHGGQVEWLILSDSVIVLDAAAGLVVVRDNRVDATAAAAQAETVRHAPGTVAQVELRRQMVTERRLTRNRPGGYWVASTDPDAAAHAVTGQHPAADVSRALVATDGAARLVDVFNLADWRTVLDLVAAAGPAELVGRVRTAEDSDPDGVRWPRTKRHDDATAAYCEELGQ